MKEITSLFIRPDLSGRYFLIKNEARSDRMILPGVSLGPGFVFRRVLSLLASNSVDLLVDHRESVT